ncbi:MAG TPA: hypothetical protein VIH94_02815 [Candidatus Limnocylindrales bacterium]
MDDDPNEMADDLLTLGVGQPGVEVPAELAEQIDCLGSNEFVGWTQRSHPPLGGHLLGGDGGQFGIDVRVAELAQARLMEDVPPPLSEPLDESLEDDRVGFGNRSRGLLLASAVELGKDVAGIPKEPLDVRPDGILDEVASDRGVGAATGMWTTLDELPVAAVPGH